MTFDNFQLIGAITEIEVIAVGTSVRERHQLAQRYGRGRKLKGIATIKLDDGVTYTAEVHWPTAFMTTRTASANAK